MLESTLSGLFNQGRDLARITCDTSGLTNSGGLCPSEEVCPSWTTLGRLLTQGRSKHVVLRQTDQEALNEGKLSLPYSLALLMRLIYKEE